jgi:hypothetical protein
MLNMILIKSRFELIMEVNFMTAVAAMAGSIGAAIAFGMYSIARHRRH